MNFYHCQFCRFELCLYPRYHLDEASLLCRKQLPGKPIAMDVWQDYILVTCSPFDIYVFKVHIQGELSSRNTATVQVGCSSLAKLITIKLKSLVIMKLCLVIVLSIEHAA